MGTTFSKIAISGIGVSLCNGQNLQLQYKFSHTGLYYDENGDLKSKFKTKRKTASPYFPGEEPHDYILAMEGVSNIYEYYRRLYSSPTESTESAESSELTMEKLNKDYKQGKYYLHGLDFEVNHQNWIFGTNYDLNGYINAIWIHKWNGFLPMISTVHRPPSDIIHLHDFLYGNIRLMFNEDHVFLHAVGNRDIAVINPGGWMEKKYGRYGYSNVDAMIAVGWNYSCFQPATDNFKSEAMRIRLTLDNPRGDVPYITVNKVYEENMKSYFELNGYLNHFGKNISKHIEYFSNDNPIGAKYPFGEGVISVNMNIPDIATNIPIGITWHRWLSFDMESKMEILKEEAENLRKILLTNLKMDDQAQYFPIVWLDVEKVSNDWILWDQLPDFDQIKHDNITQYLEMVAVINPSRRNVLADLCKDQKAKLKRSGFDENVRSEAQQIFQSACEAAFRINEERRTFHFTFPDCFF